MNYFLSIDVWINLFSAFYLKIELYLGEFSSGYQSVEIDKYIGTWQMILP